MEANWSLILDHVAPNPDISEKWKHKPLPHFNYSIAPYEVPNPNDSIAPYEVPNPNYSIAPCKPSHLEISFL